MAEDDAEPGVDVEADGRVDPDAGSDADVAATEPDPEVDAGSVDAEPEVEDGTPFGSGVGVEAAADREVGAEPAVEAVAAGVRAEMGAEADVRAGVEEGVAAAL